MERKPPARLTQEIYFWLQTFTIGLVAVILVFTFLGRPVVVDGDSMLPTLSHGDVMLVRQVGYTPQQGDVVVLTKYFEDVTGPIVKRVIATAGQTVEIDYAGNTVTVDGVVLEEDYTLEPMVQGSWQTITSITVPEGCVFVMGDNRNISNDSRNPALGAVDTRYILGQAVAVLLPPAHVGEIS